MQHGNGQEWMANIAMRSSLERSAHLLCELLERLGLIGQTSDSQFDLPLTQVHTAETLGLSRRHVNRVLQSPRRDGPILLRERHLQVLAPRRLHELAEFEAGYP